MGCGEGESEMKYRTNNPFIFVGVITVVGGLVIASAMIGLGRDWIAFALGAFVLAGINSFKFNDKGILD